MAIKTTFLAIVGLFILSSDVVAQTSNATRVDDVQTAGFGDVVLDTLARMKGEWRIKTATLQSAGLPLDQFESLTVDDKGFTLKIQHQTMRFAFTTFDLKSRRFLATSADPESRNKLTYEIRIVDQSIQIRYRTDNAATAPEPTSQNNQLLVQTWAKIDPN